MVFRKLFFCIFAVAILLILPRIHAQESSTMNVTASVPPKPTDYQMSAVGTPGENQLPQGTYITYTITYGTTLLTDTAPVTLEAQLLPGRVMGVTIPSLYPAVYISGSATSALSESEPVLDSMNHTITWSLANLPAQTTDQTVSFKVKLTDSYTGSQAVDFDVAVKLVTPYTTLNQTVSKSYLYHPIITTPTPTPSSVPTPSPLPLYFTENQIHTLTETSADISFSTTIPTTATVYYGTKQSSFTDTVVSAIPTRNHHIVLTALKPDTTYYYYIVTRDGKSGRTYRSTRNSFRTASGKSDMFIDLTSLIISSGDTIFNPLSYSGQDSSTSAILTLPINTEYGFQIRFPFSTRVARVQAVLRNADVLGSWSESLLPVPEAEAAEPTTDTTEMTEAAPGVYMGTLKTKPDAGIYEFILRVADVYGNISEKSVGKVLVVRPFTVTWDSSEEPVEHARIFLSRYNLKNDTFTPLSPTFLSANNPIYTKQDGTASFVLPFGHYKAEISYRGSKAVVEFDMSGKATAGYPLVRLKELPFSLKKNLQYYMSTLLDVLLRQTILYVRSLRDSIALYDLTGAISLTLLVILTVISFISRTFIRITAIPTYVLHMLHSLFGSTSNVRYIVGTVIDGATRKPIALTHVTVTDTVTNTVIATLQTDRSGHYFQAVKNDGTYQIQVIKRGYEHLEPVMYQPELSPYHIIHVLYVTKTHKKNALHTVLWMITTVFGFCFEILLGLSVLFELLFMEYFGLSKTLPYFTISLLNLLLWWLYLHHVKRHTIE